MKPEVRALRAMVVDDSAYNRRTIGDILASIEGVDVVGKAADGEEALRVVTELAPDFITLDLEMPRMDGFTFLRLLMAKRPIPVIVVSGRSAKADVFKALELGAIDFVVKPSATVSPDLPTIRDALSEKVAMVRQLKPIGRERAATATGLMRVATLDTRPMPEDPTPRRVIVIGSSTGGPPALVEIFSKLPSDLPAAIVIAQHMPERFTRTFAERLERLGGLRVAELEEREPLRAGRAVVCPGGRSVEIVVKGAALWVRTTARAAGDRYLPSVDRLFDSAASAAGYKALGIVLTGMGDDGARGAGAIRMAGGHVIAESEETAAIYGMPAAAVRAGAVDESLPLGAIADQIVRLVGGSRRGG